MAVSVFLYRIEQRTLCSVDVLRGVTVEYNYYQRTVVCHLILPLRDAVLYPQSSLHVVPVLSTDLSYSRNFFRSSRSAIFYHDDDQAKAAQQVIAAVRPKFPKDIVTEVNAASTWCVIFQ